MTLSAAGCADLEPLAAEWLAREVSEDQLIRALTAGLPPKVHHPRALARRRLVDKLLPEPVAEVKPTRPSLRLIECLVCRDPGRPGALPGGVCRSCRDRARPTGPPGRSRRRAGSACG